MKMIERSKAKIINKNQSIIVIEIYKKIKSTKTYHIILGSTYIFEGYRLAEEPVIKILHKLLI